MAVRGYSVDADYLMAKVAEEYGERARDALYRIIRHMPPAQTDRSLWFRIGEICVDESKGIISADSAVEKIRELLREAGRREDE